MTIEEFSNGFDVLADSYRRLKDFDSQLNLDSIEFTEYEKSIFLTKAQEEIVKQVYSGDYPPDSFEKSESVRRQLDALVKQADLTQAIEGAKILDSLKHSIFTLPSDCWYIIYEQAKLSDTIQDCMKGKVLSVVPTTHDEYFKVISNPFRGPNKRKILRLDSGSLQVELVSSYDISTYTLRYIAKPTPIVLCDLSQDDIDIDGVNKPQNCKLSDIIHQDILERAVNMALSLRVSKQDNKGK